MEWNGLIETLPYLSPYLLFTLTLLIFFAENHFPAEICPHSKDFVWGILSYIMFGERFS